MSAPPEAESPSIPGHSRAVAFGVTWLAYATFYLGRKGLSVVKTSVTADLGEASLYGVETALLVAYAIGQYVNGYLGDMIGGRRLLVAGLVVSAAACVAFGLSSAWPVFLVLFAINGFAQSAGWPGCNKAMSEWTTPADRGRVMGVWSTCYQVGPIIATALAARLMVGFGWRGAFVGPAVVLVLVAVLVTTTLKRGPHAAKTVAASSSEADRTAFADERRNRVADQKKLLQNPIIYFYGAAYFSIKLVRYSLFFWLPTYLEHVLHYDKSTASYLSTSFDIGGLFGTILLGFLSDRMRSVPRAGIALVSLVMLAGALALYARFGSLSMPLNFGLMALVGLLLYGPDSIISGAAAQDAGGKHAASLAAGLINGIGSMGAIFQEAAMRTMSSRFGWASIFQLFIWLALASALCLVPTILPKRRTAEAVA